MRTFFMATVAFFLAASASAAVITVPGDYPDIQSAIDASQSGDLITVSSGTYVENLDFKGKAITVKSDGGPGATVVDGSQKGSAVLFKTGETRNAVLEGFTIRNGSGEISGTQFNGGGIYCDGASPTIRDNVIESNQVNMNGAGICCVNGADALITGNEISGNDAGNRGGGIACIRSSPELRDNEITDNEAALGGGIDVSDNAAPTVYGNIVSGNFSRTSGGGISCEPGATAFPIVNNLLASNSANIGGGGILCTGGTGPYIVNNTIAQNRADDEGEGIALDNSSALILNTIVYGNGSGPSREIHLSQSNPTIEHCAIRGGWSGTGNIADDPLMFSPETGEFHVPFGSPCIDAGTGGTPVTVGDDLDGHGRPIDGDRNGSSLYDIGCYELNPIYYPGSHATIRSAVLTAGFRDTLVIDPGTYQEARITVYNKNITIQSASGPESTVIDGMLAGGSVFEFKRTSISHRGGSILYGFTITNGFGRGGGVECVDLSMPVIKNNLIRANATASAGAGGVYTKWSSLPVILDNEISGNTGTVTNSAGGIRCTAAVVLKGNRIFGNTTSGNGGGVWIDAANTLAEVTGNVVTGNEAALAGGGVYLSDPAACLFANNHITSNKAAFGGGVAIDRGNPVLTNNTIFENSANDGGGIYFSSGARPGLANTIVWNNSATNGFHAINGDKPGNIVVTHSLVQGGWQGSGNIDADPLFFCTEAGEFHLPWISPCIDGGDRNAPGVPPLDMNGKSRVVDGDDNGTADVDIGCFELNPIYVPQDRPTVSDALLTAAPWDSIVVDSGTHIDTVDLGSLAIILDSRSGAEATVLDGGGLESVIARSAATDAPAIIHGLTLRNGRGYPIGADRYGGALYCAADTVQIVKSSVFDASWASRGGGIYCGRGSTTTVTQCRFTGNSALTNGGAIEIDLDCDETIVRESHFEGNSVEDNGGAIFTAGSSPLIAFNTFRLNNASGSGGAVYCYQSGVPVLVNNVFNKNTAELAGGAVVCEGADALLTNNTIAGNAAKNGTTGIGGGIYLNDSSAEITNTIVHNNYAATGPEMAVEWQFPSTYDPRISYSLVRNGQAGVYVKSGITLDWGANMLGDDPLLFRPAGNDFHLTWGSLCIDRGSSTAPHAPDRDLDGSPRSAGGSDPDIGADEIVVIRVPADYPSIQDAIEAAVDWETIVVDPGSYVETLDFKGKKITVKGKYGNGTTLIDGGKLGPVVSFTGGEGPDSIVDGLTLANGFAGNGGGVYCVNSSPTIVNSRIISNAANSTGGGIYCEGSAALLANNIIVSNTSTDDGAGVFCTLGSDVTLTSNTIWGNAAGSSGAGGGLACTANSKVTVRNTVFWDNTAPQGPEMYIGNPSEVDIGHCDLEGGQGSVHVETGAILAWGNGMIDRDPGLFDTDGIDDKLTTWGDNDFHMTYLSDCRDAGDPNAPGLMPRDFDGNTRKLGRTDIGADEFDHHLYVLGDLVAGGRYALMNVGAPAGTNPKWNGIVVGQKNMIAPYPTLTQYGWFHMVPGAYRYINVGLALPGDGIQKYEGDIPSVPQGTIIPVQSMIKGKLTNLATVPVML